MNLNHIFFKDQIKKFNVSKIKFSVKYSVKPLKIKPNTVDLSAEVLNETTPNRNGDLFENIPSSITFTAEPGQMLHVDNARVYTEPIGYIESFTPCKSIEIPKITKTEKIVRKINKLSSIFFAEETKKTKALLENSHFKRLYYIDIKKVKEVSRPGVQVRVTGVNSGFLDVGSSQSFSMGTTLHFNGNVGIGTNI